MSSSNKHTVGLLGSNGRVGSVILAALLEPSRLDQISLVVFHRPGSSLKVELPTSVETREIDIEGDVNVIKEAVKGIEIFVSAVGQPAIPQERNLVEALAKSPDTVTFIPSAYVNNWTDEQLADHPRMDHVHAHNSASGKRAEELGLGVTRVYAGLFAEFFFEYAFLQVSVKANTVQLNAAQRKNKNPLVSLPYLGTGIANLLVLPPKSIKNKAYSFNEYWSSGDEMINALTEINGSVPRIIDYTKADAEALMEQLPVGFIAAAAKDAWAADNWAYEGETKVIGWKGKSLTEFGMSFK